eukprot:gene793-907_t
MLAIKLQDAEATFGHPRIYVVCPQGQSQTSGNRFW